jgi:fermentation-respiration switch protein FrsA (DUF1100 family)
MREIPFTSGGVACAAWHLPANSSTFADPQGRPCVVMAHGFGGTRDSGLLRYAEPIAEAGIDALVFDYRGFGDSGGEPRQLVSFRRQREDYRAAVAAARSLPGVDPERIVLSGTSYSGRPSAGCNRAPRMRRSQCYQPQLCAMASSLDICPNVPRWNSSGLPGRLSRCSTRPR